MFQTVERIHIVNFFPHLTLYEGGDVVERWNFAFYDSNEGVGGKGRLLLARDKLGIKPLYYSITPEGLTYASEIKAILKFSDISRKKTFENYGNYTKYNSIVTAVDPSDNNLLPLVKTTYYYSNINTKKCRTKKM